MPVPSPFPFLVHNTPTHHTHTPYSAITKEFQQETFVLTWSNWPFKLQRDADLRYSPILPSTAAYRVSRDLSAGEDGIFGCTTEKNF